MRITSKDIDMIQSAAILLEDYASDLLDNEATWAKKRKKQIFKTSAYLEHLVAKIFNSKR